MSFDLTLLELVSVAGEANSPDINHSPMARAIISDTRTLLFKGNLPILLVTVKALSTADSAVQFTLVFPEMLRKCLNCPDENFHGPKSSALGWVLDLN